MAPLRISRPSRTSRRRLQQRAYYILFGVAGFWILAVFALVHHAMRLETVRNAAHHPTTTTTSKSTLHLRVRMTAAEKAKEKATATIKSNIGNGDGTTNETTTAALRQYASPLIIFACHRAEYLNRSLTQVLQYVPRSCLIGCPIIISQDGNDADVARIITDFQNKYQKESFPIVHIQHEPTVFKSSDKLTSQQQGYMRLADHYGWALAKVFGGSATTTTTTTTGSGSIPNNHNIIATFNYPKPERVIILEEDLLISPDFFDYFAAMAPLLDNHHENLFSVSAFNDNGKKGHVKDATRVLRSDFFPGLGWMMNRKLWDTELSSKWPNGYWDDWLREPQQRQGRHVLRPEVSRTFHFGVKGGTSLDQFGSNLHEIHLNNEVVQWSEFDPSSLHESAYDQSYYTLISNAQPVNGVEEAIQVCSTRNARLEYRSLHEFIAFAESLGIMKDEKAGIPRTAYRGVVEVRPHGDFLLFLIPPFANLKATFVDPHHHL